MTLPTISLAMIARDRGRELARALESVRGHVDEIVVVDAGGSTDDTVAVAKSYGARVIPFLPKDHPESFYIDDEAYFRDNWQIPGPYSNRMALADFSAPRNLSFSECTKDFIFWIDSDDVVKGAEHLRRLADTVVKDKLDGGCFYYEYSYDDAGNCTLKQVRERLFRRSDFVSGKVRWTLPIHEHIIGMKRGALFEDVIVEHHSPVVMQGKVMTGSLEVQSIHRDQVAYRNLKNLIVELIKHPDEKELHPRILYYLGVEFRRVNVPKAVEYFHKYLAISGWDEERAQTRYYLGQIKEMQLRNEEAWEAFSGAVIDFPYNPAPWFGLARLAFVRGEWQKVIEFSEKGFAQVGDHVVGRKAALVLNPFEWKYRAHLCYSRALIEVGRLNEALDSCKQGLSVVPDCKFLRSHVEMAMQAKKEAAQRAA